MCHVPLQTEVRSFWCFPVMQSQRGQTCCERLCWCASLTSGPTLPRHRSDCSSGRSLKSFILKSVLTGDDMMETGLLNWLCPLSLSFHCPTRIPSSPGLSLHPLLFVPSSFFFTPFSLLYSSLGCVEHTMSDYFPADTALCDRGLELYISGWHPPAPPTHSADNIKYRQAFLITLKACIRRGADASAKANKVFHLSCLSEGHMWRSFSSREVVNLMMSHV